MRVSPHAARVPIARRALLILAFAPSLSAGLLVSHADEWRYRKGTSEPSTEWHRVPDAGLDAGWLTGPGGFGYGDDDDATVLDDMPGGYTSLYIRRSFQVTPEMDPASLVQLTVDYDDAFIAYLDGVEVARSLTAGGVPGTLLPHTHEPIPWAREASAGEFGIPSEAIVLGRLGDLLTPGEHVLAIHGRNREATVGDFSLIVDLDLLPPPEPITWTREDSPVELTADLVIDWGGSLTIEGGVEVRLAAGVSIRAVRGSRIELAGTPDAPVLIRRAGDEGWGALSAGGGGSLTIRHADLSGGAVLFLEGVAGLVEDSTIRDSAAAAIVYSRSAEHVTMRRSRVVNFGETLFQGTLTVIEDSLFENVRADAIDFDSARVGSVIRRCTFRNGPGANTDAIDLGPIGRVPSRGVLIEDCLMHDFGDKGVSVGDGPWDATGIVIRNCLIERVGSGVQVKHASSVTVQHCTIVDCAIGLHGFEKPGGVGGGLFPDTHSNILSGNRQAVVVETSTVLPLEFSNTRGSDWPGTGNVNVDPRFRDPATGDYRLVPGSPCRGSGKDGADMGVRFPVGGLPAAPAALRVTGFDGREAGLAWTDPDGRESSFVVERSADGVFWEVGATVAGNVTTATVIDLESRVAWYFRVRGRNLAGHSLPSGLAASDPLPDDRDGDGLPDGFEERVEGMDPDDPADALEDLDGDGQVNRAEFLAGTDLLDRASFLRIKRVSRESEGHEIVFPAEAGRSYSVEFSEEPGEGRWTELVKVAAAPDARPELVIRDGSARTDRRRFYRVVTPARP